jgi:hypothetical protein
MQELHRRKNLVLAVRGQIQFEQSVHQKEYLFWKHQELSSISYKNISIAKRFDKRYKHKNSSY